MKIKIALIIFLLIFMNSAFCQSTQKENKGGKIIQPDSSSKTTALALVQKQVVGYNARNLSSFLEPYSDNVEIYLFPDKLISKGKENMQKTYREMFLSFPELHCEIKDRLIQGNIVIDKELISGMGNTKIESTTIFHIQNNKIAKVYFIE